VIFPKRFKYVASDLTSLPDETVIDGELVALDEQGQTQLQSAPEFPLGGNILISFHWGWRFLGYPCLN
jgi:hypothetical protein